MTPTNEPLVMRIISLVDGTRTPFDGKFVKEYDPSRDGVDPLGAPMIAHVVVTVDRTKAMKFKDLAEARDTWMLVDPRRPVRPDGQPNRPLTAFNISIEKESP